MDKLDNNILQILDWNGRTPINRIAKQVKSNKDVVAYRIKRLEQQGIIKRYFPVLDMYKIGYQTSRVYFDVQELNEQEEFFFIQFLDKEINAGLIFKMDHSYRYGVFIWSKSLYDIEKTIKKIKTKLGKSLLRYHHSLICTFRQYPKDYLFGKAHHEHFISLEPKEKVEYDEVDFKILKQLVDDAKLSTVQIAQFLKIPQTTVSHKIKILEKKGIILGYRAEIDFIKLGYTNYFLEIYLETNENINKIESWANQNKNVVWLQKIIGTCDIEIEVEVKDRPALEVLLNELRSKFKNIRKIVFFSQEYKKLTFLP